MYVDWLLIAQVLLTIMGLLSLRLITTRVYPSWLFSIDKMTGFVLGLITSIGYALVLFIVKLGILSLLALVYAVFYARQAYLYNKSPW